LTNKKRCDIIIVEKIKKGMVLMKTLTITNGNFSFTLTGVGTSYEVIFGSLWTTEEENGIYGPVLLPEDGWAITA